jgi:hypothetical protein
MQRCGALGEPLAAVTGKPDDVALAPLCLRDSSQATVFRPSRIDLAVRRQIKQEAALCFRHLGRETPTWRAISRSERPSLMRRQGNLPGGYP